MVIIDSAVNAVLRLILRTICRVDDAQLSLVPERGPLILVGNHINFLDAPMLATHLRPRPLTAFAKAETWDNPLIGRLFTMWGAIPLRRGEADVKAFRQAAEALAEGKMLAIAPEGTRSVSGSLQRGHAGVVLLAQRSGAPILPVGVYGNEGIHDNLRALRRTPFHIAVGRIFTVTAPRHLTAEERQQVTDEIMYQLAMLLPERYRGYYSDLSRATTRYLCFSTALNDKSLQIANGFQPIG